MMKRVIGLAAALAAAAAAGAQGPGRGLTNVAALPRAVPFTETVFGTAIDDPYRWMERPDARPELAAWINAASDHSTAELAALPGRAGLLAEMQAASRSGTRVSQVQEAGGRLFFEQLAPDANVPVLVVRENGRDRVLLDPMAGRDPGAPRAISSYAASPDGRFVAVHLAEGGGETGTIRLYDVATGRPGADELGPVWGEFRVGWIDDATVTYTRLAATAAGGDPMRGMVAYLHRVGTPTATDRPLLGAGVAPNGFALTPAQFPIVVPDPTSPWVLAIAGNARAEYPVALGRLADLRAGTPHWTKLADVDERISEVDIVGNTLYYLTARDDPKGELRAIDLGAGAPSLANSRRVLASGGRVLTKLAATTSGLYVGTTLPSAAGQLLFVPRGGGAAVTVPLPASQSITDMATSPDRRSVTFGMGGYTRADTYYRVTAGKPVALGLANVAPPQAARRVVREEWATAADGTRVPLTIVTAGPRHGPAPTVVEAYGSYATLGEPFYSPPWDIWNRHGGVYAFCHTRGGGELGEAWHRAGQGAAKTNAHADLIACGERLVALGYSTPATLGIFGSSAGGLLIPPVALQRPDLFAAAATRVGIVNATRLAAATNGANQYGEMGDPGTADGWRGLAAQDSTLLLPRATGGTDFLFTVGLNDKRVDPWMSAKLAAMMRARWGDRQLVLIRSDGKAGHGMGSTRDQGLEERADIFAFFLNRFGQPGFVR